MRTDLPFDRAGFFVEGVALMAPTARVHALMTLAWAEGCVRKMFQQFWRNQGGASLIEYSLLVALITILVVVGVAVAGAWAQGMWARLLPTLG
jgi:Flp pilus assembly pilin Flp